MAVERVSGNPEETSGTGLGRVLRSVLSAFFGVQSNRNRERDFTHGKLSHFVVVGLGVTTLFVLLVAGVVSLVLHLAGR
ncbi:MAG: DUF2970 domain-containing protein [Chromatiaceae bacterium]